MKLGVIAGVGDDGDLVRGHHSRQPFQKFSGAHAACQYSDHVKANNEANNKAIAPILCISFISLFCNRLAGYQKF